MAQYDPNERYTWAPDSKFELKGSEFGLILNTIRSILSTEEAAKVMLAQNANASLEAILARGVESGEVKPAEKEESIVDPTISE